ncbi:MFS family permease [Streptacidiphilus sp. BW17]|uniref:MFS transporter n=1 Tax=Streptacidiphilus sp. BW17 TaxID=3156274 RepID=UPI003511A3A7
MGELFATSRMRLFFLGNTLSTIGDYALWLAAAIWVKELTGSTATAGITFLCLTCGTLLSPLTGILVDRVRRRRLLILTNALTGLLVLSLALVHQADQVWLVFVVMFLYGISSSITSAATTALLPQLVPAEQLGNANGLTQALTQGQRLITPALGVGLLSLAGGGAVAALDAATFAASVLCWSFIRVEEERPQPSEGHWLRETTEGFRYLMRTPVLRQLTLVMTVALFVVGFFETLGIAIATTGLHHAPSWMGVLSTAMGISGLVGGILAGPLMQRTSPGLLAALGLALVSGGALLLMVRLDWVVVAGGLLLGAGVPLIIVGAMSAMQLNTPEELLGRVSGADNFLVTGGQSVGIAAGAALITTVPYQALCATIAVVLCACAIYLTTRREQRAVPVPAEA